MSLVSEIGEFANWKIAEAQVVRPAAAKVFQLFRLPDIRRAVDAIARATRARNAKAEMRSPLSGPPLAPRNRLHADRL
jgi:hypothetical protein